MNKSNFPPIDTETIALFLAGELDHAEILKIEDRCQVDQILREQIDFLREAASIDVDQLPAVPLLPLFRDSKPAEAVTQERLREPVTVQASRQPHPVPGAIEKSLPAPAAWRILFSSGLGGLVAASLAIGMFVLMDPRAPVAPASDPSLTHDPLRSRGGSVEKPWNPRGSQQLPSPNILESHQEPLDGTGPVVKLRAPKSYILELSSPIPLSVWVTRIRSSGPVQTLTPVWRTARKDAPALIELNTDERDSTVRLVIVTSSKGGNENLHSLQTAALLKIDARAKNLLQSIDSKSLHENAEELQSELATVDDTVQVFIEGW